MDDRSTRGVAFDGRHVWVACGDELRALDPENGTIVRTLPITCEAGTAFDGTHLYQLTDATIDRIDPVTGEVLASIPAPLGVNGGLTWAEGRLWVGRYLDRAILQVDPRTGEILKTLKSDRFVTGVTWMGNDLWHATWESDEADIRRVDAVSGEVLDRYPAAEGVGITGIAAISDDHFFCGSGQAGMIREVRLRR